MRTSAYRFLKPGSLGRWLASGMYRSPICFPAAFFRSATATKELIGKFYPFRVKIGLGKILRIRSDGKSKATLTGSLLVKSWGGCNIPSSISCTHYLNLTISGDFEVGPNVHIEVAQCAKLTLGGKKDSSASGITCDTRIMVEGSIEMDSDCIIAWHVFISGSNWHEITGVPRSPVLIGDQAWISHGVSKLKGVVIPSGCLVGAKSLVTQVFSVKKALIAGVPVKIIRNGVEWSR